jgi:hypothetical protein
MSMKKYNNIIGNRTRDLPTFSVVPQPTVLQRAPKQYCQSISRQQYSIKYVIANRRGRNTTKGIKEEILQDQSTSLV